MPIKNNIGNDHVGFSYQIDGVALAEGIQTSRIVWDIETVDAHAILNADSSTGPTGTKSASAFLHDLLMEGPMPVLEIYRAAEVQDYNKDTIIRASKKIMIIKSKKGMHGGWEWRLADSKNNKDEQFNQTNLRATPEDPEEGSANAMLSSPPSHCSHSSETKVLQDKIHMPVDTTLSDETVAKELEKKEANHNSRFSC